MTPPAYDFKNTTNCRKSRIENCPPKLTFRRGSLSLPYFSIIVFSILCHKKKRPAYAGLFFLWRATRAIPANVIEAVKTWLNSEELGILLTMLKQITA